MPTLPFPRRLNASLALPVGLGSAAALCPAAEQTACEVGQLKFMARLVFDPLDISRGVGISCDMMPHNAGG